MRCIYLVTLLPPAAAQNGGAADTAIRAALTRWMADFNDRRIDKVCDLFAPDLVAQFRGQPETGFTGLCDQLKRSLSDRTKTYSYGLAIKEVLVFGDLAIVRLVWTLTVERKDPPASSPPTRSAWTSSGASPTGSWKISRFVAYDLPP